MTLGEIVNSKGERWEIQLKGSGPTPYSRRADGRLGVHDFSFFFKYANEPYSILHINRHIYQIT